MVIVVNEISMDRQCKTISWCRSKIPNPGYEAHFRFAIKSEHPILMINATQSLALPIFPKKRVPIRVFFLCPIPTDSRGCNYWGVGGVRNNALIHNIDGGLSCFSIPPPFLPGFKSMRGSFLGDADMAGKRRF